MLILDGLRSFKEFRLPIPRFHTGHLGFLPTLEVHSFTGRPDQHGQEITLTPFQGTRSQLCLLKCVFNDDVGVVLKALSACAALKVNVLSLESATINSGANHVLFCILDWANSKYQNPKVADEGLQQKFVRLLPLLPNADERYLLLLEMLLLFCRDAIAYDATMSGIGLPKVQIRTFDALENPGATPGRLRLERDPGQGQESTAAVSLKGVIQDGDAEVIALSETETKTLRLLLPNQSRRNRFLRIAFHHVDHPGALVAIATLLERLGFNIIMSLLRKSDRTNGGNVWEMTLEYKAGDLPAQARGRDMDAVKWFASHAFGTGNTRRNNDLVKYLNYYKVSVGIPIYPRPQGGMPKPIPLPGDKGRPTGEEFGIVAADVDAQLDQLRRLGENNDDWGWIAELVHGDIVRRRKNAGRKGTVFLSIPANCPLHKSIVVEELEKLGLTVDTHLTADNEDIAKRALAKIKAADFFFSVWHPDGDGATTISPWMPFEFGLARAFGKPQVIMLCDRLVDKIRRRIDPSTSRIEYPDVLFKDRVSDAIAACKKQWLRSTNDELSIDI